MSSETQAVLHVFGIKMKYVCFQAIWIYCCPCFEQEVGLDERNCYLLESSWGSDNHRGFRTGWPVLCTAGFQTPSSVKPKQITLTANRLLLPAQLRGIWKLNFANSFGMKSQELDVKMQCDEMVSIKYQINSFFKMVTEAYVPLKLHTHTACFWQFIHETGNLCRER